MTSSIKRFLQPSLIAIAILSSALGAIVGCDGSDSSTDPRPACPPTTGGTNCVGPTGGGQVTSGGGGSGGTGGEGGSAATNDVTGNVGVLSDSSFSKASSYIGASTIKSTATSGAPLEAPYGDTTTSFSLLDVKVGATWFFVQDQTVGATGIFSTHSIVNVPVSGPVTLPVVDRSVITSIAASLPTPIVIDGSRGIVIIKVVHNGVPMSGVSLTTPLSGATLAYDTGVGLYSNQVVQTGPAGVILALNVDGPAAAQLMDLTLTDVNQQGYFVQIRIQAATATFAGFEL